MSNYTRPYSQRDEEQYILQFFGTQKGTFLDIGAYHPFVFSTTRALYEQGWKGTMIEPAKSNFEFIKETYKEDELMEILQTCIGSFDGEIEFWDSNGDALSSTSKAHVDKWARDYGSNFTKTISPVITFDTLLRDSMYNTYNFINIDVEDTNLEILKTIDPDKVDCRMICIEFDNHEQAMKEYLIPYGFQVIHKTSENLIFAR